jgi:hypothetical protein
MSLGDFEKKQIFINSTDRNLVEHPNASDFTAYPPQGNNHATDVVKEEVYMRCLWMSLPNGKVEGSVRTGTYVSSISGTAQDNAGANTLEIEPASGTANALAGLKITVQTTPPQTRVITAYNQATNVITVDSNWSSPAPANGDDYVISGVASMSLLTTGAVGNLNTDSTHVYMVSGTDLEESYTGLKITIISGKGAGQTRDITAYDHTIQTATITPAFTITPDNTSNWKVHTNYLILGINSSDTDDAYQGLVVTVKNTSDVVQVRNITKYLGGYKLAFVDTFFGRSPVEGDVFIVDTLLSHPYVQVDVAFNEAKVRGIISNNTISHKSSFIMNLPSNPKGSYVLCEVPSTYTKTLFYTDRKIDVTIRDPIGNIIGGTGNISISSGTLAAVSGNNITLDASSSSLDNYYKGYTVTIASGPGIAQTRTITSYNGTTKVAACYPPWNQLPTTASTYTISYVPTFRQFRLMLEATPVRSLDDRMYQTPYGPGRLIKGGQTNNHLGYST